MGKYNVVGINPKSEDILEQKILPSLTDLNFKPDLVIIVVPPHIALTILQEIAKLKIRTIQKQVSVTVSLGFTMHSADDISIDSLLKRADDALYKAKNAGRNQIVCL